MKILRLELFNLASLEGQYVIDFTSEPLASAGVFAITGPTGAGKSTILDGICLALYGNAPRYNNWRDGSVKIADQQNNEVATHDVRNILRKGAGKGYAKVDFQGVDQVRYQAIWEVRRAREQATGALQASKNQLTCPGNPSYIVTGASDFKAAIEAKTGLNYEQFTRSVLLAQGDFTAFLKASSADKAALLEKLSGTGIYSTISMKIFSRFREEEGKLRQLAAQLDRIQLLNEQDRHDLEQSILQLQSEEAKTKEYMEQCLVAAQWLRSFQTIEYAVEEAQQRQSTALIAQEAMTETFRQLQRVEAARQPISALRQLQERAAQIEQRLRQYEELEIKKQQCLTEEGLRQQALDQARAQLEQLQQEMAGKQPLFQKGRILEQQLRELNSALQAAERALQVAREQRAEAIQQQEAVRQELSELEAREIALQQWRSSNANHQQLAEQENLLIDYLNRIAGLRQSNTQALNTKNEKEIQRQAAQNAQTELNAQSEHLRQGLAELQAQQQQVQQALSALDATALRTRREALQHATEAWTLVTTHWTATRQAQAELLHTQQQCADWQAQLQTKEVERLQAEQQLQQQQQELQGAQRIVEQTRLFLTENVEELRRQLTPGEPCTVCGSTHHPFAHEQPGSNLLLQELEAKLEVLNQGIGNTQNLLGGLNQAIDSLQRSLSAGLEQEKQQREQLEQLEANWPSNPASQTLQQLDAEARSNWLEQQQQSLQQERSALEAEQANYDRQTAQLLELQDSLQQQSRQQQELQQQEANTRLQLAQLEAAIQQLQEQLQRDQLALGELEAQLSGKVDLPDWEPLLKQSPTLLAQRIQEAAATWRSHEQDLQQLQLRITARRGDLNLQQVRVTNAETASSDCQQTVQQHKERIEASVQELQQYLDGCATIEEAEHKLQHPIQQLQHELDLLQEQKRKLEMERNQFAVQQSSLLQENNSDQLLVEQREQEIQGWLELNSSEYNREDLLALCQVTDAWIEQSRIQYQQISATLLEKTTILRERKEQLEQHLLVRPTLAEKLTHIDLEAILFQMQNDLEELQRQQIEHLARKQADDELKAQNQQLKAQYDDQALRLNSWAKLSDFIGSADGATFRKVAQQYTLDNLLGYANVHLQQLNPRYELQRIPKQVSIQIIDRNMGDEIRPVNSLSGGETFLVSLALALGLASLAAQQIRVESLFIDEGFGSLDPQTLTVAMDALERLQSMGRKVGVISHVQEMTERIPVQIKVQKSRGGSSKLVVE